MTAAVSVVSERAEVARRGLEEITAATDVGDLVSETDEGDGVSTVQFEATMLGYPGWRWTVAVASVDGDAPTVLEAELLPADGALLAPDWVPWSERLEELNAAKAAAAEAGETDDGDDDGDDDELGADDENEDDEDDDDDDEDDDDDDEEDDLADDDLDEDGFTDADDADDLGDDVYDGLDPESALPTLPDGGVDEADQPEA